MRIVLVLIFLALLCACASDDAVSKRKPGQQLVCHKGHTRAVTTGDFFVHQDHGDTVGPCPTEQ